MPEKKIEDFGEKIEGARKDLNAIRSGIKRLDEETLEGWTDKEREQYITKDLVWKKPDYQKMLDEGADKSVLYYIKLVRDSLPARPVKNDETWQRGYVNFVTKIKDWAMDLKEPYEFDGFKRDLMDNFLEKSGYHRYSATEETYGCFQNKLLRAISKSPDEIRREMEKKQFLYSPDEKAYQKHITLIASPKDYHHTDVQQNTFSGQPYMRIELYRNEHSFSAALVKVPEENKEHPIDFIRFFDKNSFDYEEDKYFVLGRNCEMLFHGIDTKEEAERLALEYARKAENIGKDSKKAPVSGRKAKLLPPQLDHIRRTGEEHRENDRHISGEDILESFKLRGGQFGNWTNQNDRQTSMDMCFDAFRDLAVALDIAYEDIALKQSNDARTNSLAIAFGARGHSSALAHYEPVENVINLTKMNGAGSLAHEWGHALDTYIKAECGLKATMTATKAQKYMASHCYPKDNPFNEVVAAMNMKEVDGERVATDYYKESKETDGNYSSTDNGYWRSNCEMFARAFACYVHDKLAEKGIRSDYLCGHSEATVYPKGEERKAINEAINNLIDDLKDRGLLHHKVHDIQAEAIKAPAFPEYKHDDTAYDPNAFGEQMSLFDLFDINADEPELPTKEDVDNAPAAAASVPLPETTSRDKFDLADLNANFSLDSISVVPYKEGILPTEYGYVTRFEVSGFTQDDLTDAQVKDLLDRAELEKLGGAEFAESAFYSDKKLYLDVLETGDIEAALVLNNGRLEICVQLNDNELQYVKESIASELELALPEKLELLEQNKETDRDMTD